MSTFSPSYLFKNRFGKYYFRCRIPIDIRKKYNLKKVEVRKSLGTGNRTEALRLSRILWVEMEKNGFKQIDIDSIDDHDRLLREGRPLYEELALLESKPNYIPSDTDDFFDWLSPFQRKAVAVCKEFFTKRQKDKPPPQDSRQPNEIKSDISQENFAEQIVEKLQQAGKKKLTIIGLQEASDKYISYASKLNGWSNDYIDKHVVDIEIFIQVIDADTCCDITSTDIIKYRDVIANLPYRYDLDKDCKGLTYEEMASLPNKKRASVNTLVNKTGVVKNFLRWCEESNHIDIDFDKPLKSKKKSRTNKKNRVAYTPDELNRLFNSKQYSEGTHKNSARHWVLLIALFTGARLNEICQLHKDNIVKDSLSSLWYFDFNDYSDDRSKKTNAAIRFVPIHPQLRRLGFFRFLDSVPDGGRLFPMLTKKDNRYGTAITKFYSTYKNSNNCNITIPDGIMKDFHSFRNTLINAIKQSGVPESSAREVVGHENPSLAYGGYADPLDLPNRKKIIDKVKYPSIDWSLVKEREWWKNQ